MEKRGDGMLLELTANGDHEAFATLVDRYKDPLVNYLTHMTGSRDRAEDFGQEAFVRLFENASRYTSCETAAPLLYRIATNLVKSAGRRFYRWNNVLSLLGAPSATSPQYSLLEEEIRRQVTEALASLPVAFRAAVVLREIENWSYAEIAAAIGCREGTVKSKIARGREMLRRSLAPYWNGGLSHESRLAG